MYRAQKYPSCQLIAAINARIFLGLGDVSDAEFEKLVDLTRCRHGAAINVEDAYPFLGIKKMDGEFSLEWIQENLPVVVKTHEIEHHGLHQILITGVRDNILEVVNFYKPFLTWEELVKLQPAEHLRECFAYEGEN